MVTGTLAKVKLVIAERPDGVGAQNGPVLGMKSLPRKGKGLGVLHELHRFDHALLDPEAGVLDATEGAVFDEQSFPGLMGLRGQIVPEPISSPVAELRGWHTWRQRPLLDFQSLSLRSFR